MLFEESSLRDRAREILKGKHPDNFLETATKNLRGWLEENPTNWVLFGPYWGCVWRLMRKYQPDFDVSQWNNGENPPSYLANYRYQSPIMEWVAAMEYLNRHGDRVDMNTDESILMPNGDRATYRPTVGMIDERG